MCQTCLSNTGQTNATASFWEKDNQQLQEVNLCGLSPLDTEDEDPFQVQHCKIPAKGDTNLILKMKEVLKMTKSFM